MIGSERAAAHHLTAFELTVGRIFSSITAIKKLRDTIPCMIKKKRKYSISKFDAGQSNTLKAERSNAA
jgi:hypothetical protein